MTVFSSPRLHASSVKIGARVLLGFLLMVPSLTGCGPSETSIPVEEPSADAQVREILNQYKEAGAADSSVVTLKEQLEAMAAEDPSKAELVAEADKLMNAGSPEDVRAIVDSMLSKLN